MRITIPDDVVVVYEEMAAAQGRPVEAVVADQLTRFAALVPGTRAVVLGDAHCARLAAALAVEQIRDADHLVARAEAYGAVRFEGIALRLTPAQREELVRRAERQGRSVKALVQEIANRLLVDFFWTSGAGEPAGLAARKAG